MTAPTSPEHRRVLIAGVSTRAAAESAARAGFDTIAIDAFADLDHHPSVRTISVPDGYSSEAAANRGREVECDAVVYLSGFENHPEAVAVLAADRTLWGNPPAILRRVRDPVAVARAFRSCGHAVPAVELDAPVRGIWLVKPLAGGGGHGVRAWPAGKPVPPQHYLQERMAGTPGSVVFVAAGGHAVPLGVSRQLIGEAAFGATGYRYCGSVVEATGAEFLAAVSKLASTAASEFDLVGVNGIDFVSRENVPRPVEVNPRWCASMELVERALGLSVFATHVAACRDGVLPEFDPHATGRAGTAGKAVVFARSDVQVGETQGWVDLSRAARIRDVPRPGQVIRRGRPVCTVFAEGTDPASCRRELVSAAAAVYAEMATWVRPTM